ncbi:MAG: polysaccharide pyruvyl transferase family protein, partial [Firmicutes bacterium]|nr:polysaccharide pyruvyl transferase family protein [Bacillota bacterium]
MGDYMTQRKSVAIITIQSLNFGNRLQNYALQEVLKTCGVRVKTLKRGTKPSGLLLVRTKLKNFARIMMGNLRGKFLSFNRLIDMENIYVEANEAPSNLKNKFDFFIAGSDQVWNPYYDFVGKSDLLYFAKHEQKISYAASFGVTELPENVQSLYTDCLSDFHRISVREDGGIRIVRELTGREAKVTLDPTLMLTADQWRG